VGGGVDPSLGQRGENCRGVDHRRLEQDVSVVVEVVAQGRPDQGEAVGAKVGGDEPDHGVTFGHPIRA
jgi:hypothetical protein